jgi:hypothetical protein
MIIKLKAAKRKEMLQRLGDRENPLAKLDPAKASITEFPGSRGGSPSTTRSVYRD